MSRSFTFFGPRSKFVADATSAWRGTEVASKPDVTVIVDGSRLTVRVREKFGIELATHVFVIAAGELTFRAVPVVDRTCTVNLAPSEHVFVPIDLDAVTQFGILEEFLAGLPNDRRLIVLDALRDPSLVVARLTTSAQVPVSIPVSLPNQRRVKWTRQSLIDSGWRDFFAGAALTLLVIIVVSLLVIGLVQCVVMGSP